MWKFNCKVWVKQQEVRKRFIGKSTPNGLLEYGLLDKMANFSKMSHIIGENLEKKYFPVMFFMNN
jgi:hypothetical protein